MDFLVNIFFIAVSFIVIWVASGFVIKAIEFISAKSKISSFVISFFVLGLLTSVPEIGIIFSSINAGSHSIAIGNLIGGILILLFIVIPLYAMLSNGIALNEDEEGKIFNSIILVLLLPFVLIYDKVVNSFDALILIGGYGFLVYSAYVSRDKSLDVEIRRLMKDKVSVWDYLKQTLSILLGIAVVLVSSDFLITHAIKLANNLGFSTFVSGLLILAIGTNLPELSIMFRAILDKRQDIALGDYLGSAVANVILIAMTVFFGGEARLDRNVNLLISFFTVAILTFFLAFRLNNKLSRFEGVILVGMYIMFFTLEVFSIR